MKVLITGGAGYVGTKLVKQVAEKKDVDEVIVYDNLSRGNYNLFLGAPITFGHKIRFIQGDILDSRQLRRIMKGVDVVYHLAAKVTTPFANTDPHYYEQTNHWGTAELVYAIEESDVKLLIYLSSTSVYGSSDVIVNEKSSLHPRTFYGVSKMRAEEHVMRLVEQGRAMIIRSGNVYGHSRSMRFDAVVNRFAFETNFYNKISIQGSGRQKRAFVHVNDLVKDLAALRNGEVPTDIYNLFGKNLSVLDLVNTFKELRPSLEFLFIDQHLELRNIEVDTNLKISNYLALTKPRPLMEELYEFLDHFSY